MHVQRMAREIRREEMVFVGRFVGLLFSCRPVKTSCLSCWLWWWRWVEVLNRGSYLCR